MFEADRKAEDTRQLKSSAYGVSDDECFKRIHNDLAFLADRQRPSPVCGEELDNEPGVLQRSADGKFTISVRRRSEVINARALASSVRSQGDLNRDHALERFRATYAHLLGGVEMSGSDTVDILEDQDGQELRRAMDPSSEATCAALRGGLTNLVVWTEWYWAGLFGANGLSSAPMRPAGPPLAIWIHGPF